MRGQFLYLHTHTHAHAHTHTHTHMHCWYVVCVSSGVCVLGRGDTEKLLMCPFFLQLALLRNSCRSAGFTASPPGRCKTSRRTCGVARSRLEHCPTGLWGEGWEGRGQRSLVVNKGQRSLGCERSCGVSWESKVVLLQADIPPPSSWSNRHDSIPTLDGHHLGPRGLFLLLLLLH